MTEGAERPPSMPASAPGTGLALPSATAPAPGAVRARIVWLLVGSIALITAAAVVMRLAGFNGWDTPAHLYKIAVLRHGGSLLWDNEWYGGAYQMVSYGFVFYWLAQFVNYSVLVVASAAVLPILFYAYMRRIYGVTGVLPSAALAVVLAVYLANGQDPFLFALALTMGGLVAAACDRRVAAALLIGVAGFANPVAVTVGAIFLVAQYLALPGRRAGLRRLALYLLPFAVARIVLALFFWEAATYQYRPIEVVAYVAFAVVGVAGARLSRDPKRAAKATLFATFGVVAVAAVALPANAMGGTFGRFFFVFGVPLLLTLRKVRLPRLALVVVLIGAAFGQVVVPATHFVSHAQGVSAKPALLHLGPGVGRRQPRPRLPFSRGRPRQPLGGLLLPDRRLRHHPGLVPAVRRAPQRGAQPAPLQRRPVRRLAARDGRRVRLPAGRAPRRVGPPGDRHPDHRPSLHGRLSRRRLDRLQACRRAAHRRPAPGRRHGPGRWPSTARRSCCASRRRAPTSSR